jgi:hypothetical protein
MIITWYSPSGVEIVFSGTSETYTLLRSVSGLGNPPVTHIIRQSPYQDGSKRIDSRYEPREISFDIMVKGPTREDLEYAKQILTTSLNALPGAGSLVITMEDGSEYVCYCIGNNTPEYSPTIHGDKYQRATIDLIAHDPFLYAYPNTMVYFGAGTPVIFPYVLPWMFPSSTPSQTCTNAGNVSSGVTIVVSGAITNPSISRTYTLSDGAVVTETIAFTLVMTAGEVLTITTGPGNKTITLLHDDDTYDTNPWQYLDAGYVFWQMVPGENVVTVSSSAIAESTVTSVEYSSKYSGI